ncbi:hypothetical protein KC19_1G134700 [Ceratodon purpureus]|uniref:DNA-directed RNA polymerase n=1 Tax=Ceratodon purpureus TaxID=3225 RepID=A0A8T0J7G1_CERPU|nr:hypothetical protein KC19_1G134700 [Ceratodon purpureus]
MQTSATNMQAVSSAAFLLTSYARSIGRAQASVTFGYKKITPSQLVTIAQKQMHGFTCGFGDLRLIPKAEKARRQKLTETDNLGDKMNARFACVDEEGEAEFNMEEIRDEVEKRMQSKLGEAATKRLDMLLTSALKLITLDINSTIFPPGLMKPFPANCLSLMTITGAKGGLVNFTQFPSLLGQQELEGKRVPRMSSGKSLPCFPPWDASARAGGFIGERFLSGLRPQEYKFHSVADRDGLKDTAVKTSRSGYNLLTEMPYEEFEIFECTLRLYCP